MHIDQLATHTLEKLVIKIWQNCVEDQDGAKRFKNSWLALLKNAEDLNEKQAITLRKLKRRGGDLWSPYKLKEALREIFVGDLNKDEVSTLLTDSAQKPLGADYSHLSP